ncbi:DNA polymerase III subunit alpha [Aestuariirhabdus sp. Z084]|uniref:DNA polymerase III subunit alpha n=1 Tax=Aestuariirhabdus haliotis TaxID=2918751 RepID=UPI00201B3EE4|nr:DNA polymerase III subunit alpha [Aestuariirhabdus haliotis]MCL6416369.1 DNA polymerase III subunit alpha [Aestuariirhabdus haliotis]MCL6420358.1 DNA polymerase III subunit alpha [Aestuariirhabdus haliotis]
MSSQFVHLRLHTEYSLVDGLVRLKPLIAAVSGMGMPAVAMTDQSNLFALVKFYGGAMGAGLKPICGADMWVENLDPALPPTRLLLLITNADGYRNLTELISRGYQHGQKQGIAVVQRDWVKQASEGLIALCGARQGEVGQALMSGHIDDAEQLLAEWRAVFGDRFYLEVQRTSRAGDEEHLHQAVALAERAGCPVVATNDVMFLDKDDYEAHETRVCVGEGRALDDPRRPRLYSEEQYLKTPAEMSELFADLPEALENSVEIARRCTIEVQLGTYFLPDYPVPEGMTMDDYFRQASSEGLEMRLKPVLEGLDEQQCAEQRKLYYDRLKFELDIIIQMGFPGYFLIVMDFIRWSKANGIPVGPGRGSGAGSLVAYALEITDLDPIPYDLLFERFLNPERVSMPDFDVDFCMDGRDRVIDYVAETYGREAVSQIITFGTMAAKAVVRDVARVQGKSYGLADKLSKMIPFEVGMTLKKAIEQEAALKEFVELDEQAGEIWEMALKLEGITRNVGKHAGGVVIAPSKLTDFAPLYCDEQGQSLVTQYDKNDVESAGLVKFDFLGLRTLTIVNWALDTVNKVRAQSDEPPLDIMQIDLEDKASFDLLKRAETTAVFQLESRGMKDLIKRLQPSNFEDIIALVALFRPGPLGSGMVDDFINRKHGREKLSYPHSDYQHDDLIPVLEPTYGIILYQEQVMQIAQVLAGFTLGGADLLRRAMGKKKPEEMAKQRVLFMDGAKGRGIDEDLSGPIFDLMEKFAGYGFNKSHSAAYALVSFQTLWLKTHYPAPFMAAVLTADMQNTDKIVTLIEECREMKLVIVPPDVSGSEYRFTVNERNEIVYGLGAIKGVGEGPIEAIQLARQRGGAFIDLFDFCKRVDVKKINKRVLEALVRAGALDKLAPAGELTLGQRRAILLAAMEDAIKAAGQSAKSIDSGHTDLFGELVAVGESSAYEQFMNARELTDKERLKGEKDTLGIYLTGHPIDEYEKELRHFVRNRINDLKPARESQNLSGLIVASRVMKNKRGDKMAFITLDDRSGRMEVSIFADCYEQYQHLITKDTLVFVEGEVSFDDYSGGLKVRAKRLMSLVEARQQYARFLNLAMTAEQCHGSFADSLAQLLGEHSGGTLVQLDYLRDDARATLRLGEEWRVEPSDELIQELKDRYGKEQVSLSYN